MPPPTALPPAPSRWRLAAAWALVFGKLGLLLAAVVGGAGFLVLRLATSGGEVPVPSLAGMPSDQAEQLLRRQRLHASVVWKKPHETAPADTVLWQKPAAGTLVRRERNVQLGLSQGPDAVSVPDFVGLPVRQAEVSLRHAGLSPGDRARVSSLAFAPDTVVGQSPPPGTRVRNGAPVGLLVNEETPPLRLRMPALEGRTLPDANRLIRELSLAMGELRKDPDVEGTPGRIVGQTPPPGAHVRAGATIALTLKPLPEGAKARLQHFRFQVPPGGGARRVRVLLVDEAGIREVFSELAEPGTQIERPLTVQGEAVAEVYVNGQFAREVRLLSTPAAPDAEEDRG